MGNATSEAPGAECIPARRSGPQRLRQTHKRAPTNTNTGFSTGPRALTLNIPATNCFQHRYGDRVPEPLIIGGKEDKKLPTIRLINQNHFPASRTGRLRFLRRDSADLGFCSGENWIWSSNPSRSSQTLHTHTHAHRTINVLSLCSFHAD